METIQVDHLIPAVNRGGKIVIDAPAGIADGEQVMVGVQMHTPTENPKEKWGMDESEWPTDPEAIEAWIRRIDALEPIDFPPEDEYDRKFREFQIEAVRLQMEQMDKGLFP